MPSFVELPGKGENKLGKLLERVRADALAGKDTELWCASRFQLPTPLDVSIDLAVIKEGRVVAEPSFEGKPIVKMGETNEPCAVGSMAFSWRRDTCIPRNDELEHYCCLVLDPVI